MTPRKKPEPKPRIGRPTIHAARMVNRTVGLPAEWWIALDEEARALGISTAELVRRKLSAGARRKAKGG